MRLTTSKGLELASSLLKDDAVSVRTTSLASSRVTGEALPRMEAKMATTTMESFIVCGVGSGSLIARQVICTGVWS